LPSQAPCISPTPDIAKAGCVERFRSSFEARTACLLAATLPVEATMAACRAQQTLGSQELQVRCLSPARPCPGCGLVGRGSLVTCHHPFSSRGLLKGHLAVPETCHSRMHSTVQGRHDGDRILLARVRCPSILSPKSPQHVDGFPFERRSSDNGGQQSRELAAPQTARLGTTLCIPTRRLRGRDEHG